MRNHQNVLDRAVEHPERNAAVALRVVEPRVAPPLGVLHLDLSETMADHLLADASS